MNKLPAEFNEVLSNNYLDIKDENILVETLEESGNLFEFAKCAFRDENWRNSNKNLLDRIILKLENLNSNNKLSLKKFNDISQLSEHMLHNNTSVVVYFNYEKTTLKINNFLLEKIKLTIPPFLDENGVIAFNFNNENIDILSQTIRIKLATDVVLKNKTLISSDIHKYKIDPGTEEGQKALIKIAKLAAQQNGRNVSLYIQNYKIDAGTKEGREALIEIAKLATQQDSKSVSEFIKKYGFDADTKEGQEALIEVAKVVAQQIGDSLSMNIENYRIDAGTEDGQKALIEIAKLIAQQDSWGLSLQIQNYGIDASTEEGREALIEIAKLAARQNCRGVSEFIKNYEFDIGTKEGQGALIEIAQVAAQQDGWGFSQYIESYQIEAPVERLKILILAFQNVIDTKAHLGPLHIRVRALVVYISKFSLPEQEPYSSIIKFMNSLSLDQAETQPTALKEFFKQKWPGISITPELKDISRLKNPNHQNSLLNWLTITMLSCASHNINEQQIQKLQDLNVFNHTLSLRIPTMRYTISNILIEHILNTDDSLNLFDTLVQNRKNEKYCVLASIFLMKMNINSSDLEKLIKSLQPMFDHFPNLNALLVALDCMGNEPDVSPEVKKRVLMDILALDPSKIIKSCNSIKNLANLNSLNILNNWESESYIEIDNFLDDKFQAIFKDRLPLKAADTEDFSRKFEMTFAKERIFASFKTYIAALNKLSNEQKKPLLDLLAAYVENVLDSEDAYKKWRYSEDGDHLKTVFSIAPSLRESWTKNIEAPLIDILHEISGTNQESSPQVFDYKGELLNAFNDDHISKEDYPDLYRFAASDKPEKIALSIPKDASKGKKEKMGFEIAAMTLCSPEITMQKQQNMLTKINRMNRLPSIFKSQVQGWINGLPDLQKKVENPYEGWTIKFTDDPFDLFLCGTEVEGSCQNVNMEIKYSKCLLAYVTDGKNKMIEVKGADGKIKARAVIRLLLNEKNNPVLFLERIYPARVSSELSNAIIQMANFQANRIGLQLLSTQVGQGEAYPYKTRSLGSRAPFEYVDALTSTMAGVIPHGRFTIEKLHLIQTP